MGEKGTIYQRTTKGPYYFFGPVYGKRKITAYPFGAFVLDIIGNITGSNIISSIRHHEIDTGNRQCQVRVILKMDLTGVLRLSVTRLTLHQPEIIR
jgi:hypothetical protein